MRQSLLRKRDGRAKGWHANGVPRPVSKKAHFSSVGDPLHGLVRAPQAQRAQPLLQGLKV